MSAARRVVRAGLLPALAASVLMAGGASAADASAGPQPSSTSLTAIAPSVPAGDVAPALQAGVLAREDATTARPAGTATTQATTGRHTLCRNASVRQADKTHVLGYAQAGDTMDVDHYATHTNPQGGHSLRAYGVAHTQAGAITGYVLYEDGTFC